MSQISIAVVGATGLVGCQIMSGLESLEEYIDQVVALAGADSVGKHVSYRGASVSVQDVNGFDFSSVNVVICACPQEVTKELVVLAESAGCFVIDLSGAFVYKPDVPMWVAGINEEAAMARAKAVGCVTLPSADSQLLLPVLHCLRDLLEIETVDVTSMHAVSGSGQKGIDELAKQTAQLLNARAIEKNVYAEQIAFNVIPMVGAMSDSGYTDAEVRFVLESKIALAMPELIVQPSFVTVPVFHGHSMTVSVKTATAVDMDQVKARLAKLDGFEFSEGVDELATPVSDAIGSDSAYIGRVRSGIAGSPGISFWLTADNLHQGAAKCVVDCLNGYLK
jgi:aspartate-semialdehyde dehydrogenase